jgi:hypothetical protein
MAAILVAIQMSTGQASTRADLQAARLAADISARISVSSAAMDGALSSQQVALMLGLDAVSRQLAGLTDNSDAAGAVGTAEDEAYKALTAAVARTTATSGGSPVDSYTASMIKATTEELKVELTEQNRQADLAQEASTRQLEATLGLSFLALSGVLTGLAAVLNEGRPGWLLLGGAGAILLAAAGLAVVAVI